MPHSHPRETVEELHAVCVVPVGELCYFRYTLEAYEGLCLPTTLPGGAGRVRVATSTAQGPQLEEVLRALSREIPLQIESWSPASPEGLSSGG